MIELTITPDAKNNRTMAWLKKITRVQLPLMSNAIAKKLSGDTARIAKNKVNNLALYHGKRPGQLAGSISAHKSGASKKLITWTVLATAPYAMFVETGTRPHPIHMPGGGIINHPGAGYNRSYPLLNFMSYSLEEASKNFPTIASDAFNRFFKY